MIPGVVPTVFPARLLPRLRRPALMVTGLIAGVVGFLTYMVLAVPVASPRLPNGQVLFFCPLAAPPLPRAQIVQYWPAALASAIVVLAVDVLVVVFTLRRGRSEARARTRTPASRLERTRSGPVGGRSPLRLERVPVRVAVLTSVASVVLLAAGLMQGYAMWIPVAFALAPWVPLVVLEAAWKYEHYGFWAIFGVVVLLQIGHMGEHTVQVAQLLLYDGQLGQSHGVFGQLDFETVHFFWDSAIWVVACLLLTRFGARNRWLWVAFAAASVHEVEHLYLYWMYLSHPGFYFHGGFEGIMGNGGLIGSPLARPYLHFTYNFVVVLRSCSPSGTKPSAWAATCARAGPARPPRPGRSRSRASRVSLTVGSGPFGRHPAGRFNVDFDRAASVLLWDPVPHRVRALLAGEVVLDSRRAVLLHETGHLPVYYFPDGDVHQQWLEPSPTVTRCPHKGEAAYWSVRVGDRQAPDAIWSYPEPIASASFLAGFMALDWHSFDEWFVEDEPVFGHPRDPYSRIDVFKTTRHVRVLLDGVTVADSRRAKVLFETALPPRYYLPAGDVRTELLVPSPTRTRCAYKGSASYWHVRVGERTYDDLVWSYPVPEHDAVPVRDLLCFFNERVDLELDGELGDRPRTQWSR